MYISEIYAQGFRCFGPDTPLILRLQAGLNILAGPNDSGKTAIIDAPRYVLWTRGDDYLRLELDDFHVKKNGERCTELLIRCSFDGLTPDEESRFLEWCTNENGSLRLHVCLHAALRKLSGGGNTVVSHYRTGKTGDGLPLEGDLREYIKATYLRPLRDAERELRSGRRSRLSRILGALPSMARQAQEAAGGNPPTLTDTMNEADRAVESNETVREVQGAVNTTYLDELSFADDPLTATLGLGAKGSFDQLLERMELYLNSPRGISERMARGLGYNNLLFMAAELLLLQSHPEQVPFLLIEEPEAHLHPQHQALFMQILENRAGKPKPEEARQQVQVLLSTHSPNFAASADLNAIILCFGHKAYPLGRGYTKLDNDDYGFLRRFLDATKANLFFARGVILVEGDAENLLLPAIAEKMGKPLGKYGVSIVNVGHRGLFRYSRILQRSDDTIMPIPVSLIPDRDIPPDDAKRLAGEKRPTESELSFAQRTEHEQNLRIHAGGGVAAFPSEQWTLEFDLARKPALASLVHQAIRLAKGSAKKKRDEIIAGAAEEVAKWQRKKLNPDTIATLIYAPLFKKSVSKAQAAEQLSFLIQELPDTAAVFKEKLPANLVEAIEHVTNSARSRAVGEAGTAETPPYSAAAGVSI